MIAFAPVGEQGKSPVAQFRRNHADHAGSPGPRTHCAGERIGARVQHSANGAVSLARSAFVDRRDATRYSQNPGIDPRGSAASAVAGDGALAIMQSVVRMSAAIEAAF